MEKGMGRRQICGGIQGREKHSQGIYIYSNGDKYVGEYKNGLKNGQGTLIMVKGNSKEISNEVKFKGNKFHGQGI